MLHRILIEDFGIHQDNEELTKDSREILTNKIPQVGDVIQLPGWQVRVQWVELASIPVGGKTLDDRKREQSLPFSAVIGVQLNFHFRHKEPPFYCRVELSEASAGSYPEIAERIKDWRYEDYSVPQIGEQLHHPETNYLFRIVDSIRSAKSAYTSVLQVVYEGKSWTPD